MEDIKLINDDCLNAMKEIPDHSIDMVLCDLPYGVLSLKWDSVIPMDNLWEEYNRVIKTNGAILLFGTEPFSSRLRLSNLDMYRYDWIWNKLRGTDFQLAKKRPMRSYENVLVFYKKLPTYNPQMRKGKPYKTKGGFRKKRTSALNDLTKGQKEDIDTIGRTFNAGVYREATNNDGLRYPLQILDFKKDCKLHPTAKPIALLEYLIKTYSNESDTILDNTMGSGSTMVACVNTNRKGIGIELDETYFNIAKKRIDDAIREKQQSLFSDL